MSLKSPFATEIEKGAYSAIVFIDGDLVVAEDNVGTVISERAKSDYVGEVIQAAADEIVQGAIFIKNANEEYIIKSGVSYPAGVSLVSDGAELDFANLNSTFLTIGSDAATPFGKITRISGFSLDGSRDNANTLFLKATNVNHGLFIADIAHENIKNIIEVRGESYFAQIHRVSGRYTGGTWIKLVSTALNKAPNFALISHCENSNGFYETDQGTGISIEACDAYAPLRVSIDQCWFEQFHTGIFTEGEETAISNSYFQCENYDINLHEHATWPTAGVSDIFNNSFEVRDSAGIGIELSGQAWRQHFISSNIFRRIDGVGIRNGRDNKPIISDNYFDLSTANAIGIGQTGTGYLRYGSIDNNTFYGEVDTYRGTAISAYATRCAIQNNNFMGLTYWLNNANIVNSLIQNNYIYHVTNMAPTVGTTNTIRNNRGYETENTGNSTGTGGQQTIAHGLSAAPTLVMVGDKENGAGPYQSAAANATNIYITAGNGLDWWWKTEI